jgi:hypothetical protein
MNMITATEIARLDGSNPEFERATPFAKMADGFTGNVVAYTLDKSAGAFNDAAVEVFTAPYAMRIIDAIALAQADSESGTVKVMKGTDDICTALVCAVNGVPSHMVAGSTAATKARMVLAAGDKINVQAAGGTAANIRAITTIICQRL